MFDFFEGNPLSAAFLVACVFHCVFNAIDKVVILFFLPEIVA